MPARILALIAALALAVVIAGCSSGASSPSDGGGASADASGSSSSESALFADQSWPTDNRAAEGVPVPEFSVAPDKIEDSDQMVGGEWKGVDDQEAADYVAELKDAGFTVQPNEIKSATNYKYFAYNSEDIASASYVLFTYDVFDDGRSPLLCVYVTRPN